MDLLDCDDVQLTEQNFRRVCRFCLRADDEFVDIFHKIEPDDEKRTLADRVYDLYHVKVSTRFRKKDKFNPKNETELYCSCFFFVLNLQVIENDGLPTNICHRCLYNTELFSEFRQSVHRCERKLRDFVQTLATHSNDQMNSELQSRSRNVTESSDVNESTDADFDQNEIIVIDPTKCYVSSDEEFDEDDDENTTNHDTSGDQPHFEMLASMYNRMALPESEQNLIPMEITPTKKTSQTNSIDGGDAFQNISFCKFCEAAFSQQKQCEAHELNNHDPVAPYVCSYCSYRFDTRLNLISHIKQLHEREKPYVCVQCNKNFGRRADLKKHAICHTGIRPFDCTVCGKTFSRKTNLTKHMKVHSATKNKPFGCKQCSRSFNTPNDLKRHERIHSDSSKSHQCPICLAYFSRRDALQQHHRKHHPDNVNAGANVMNQSFIANELNPYQTMMPFNSIGSIYPSQTIPMNQYLMHQHQPPQIQPYIEPKTSINDESRDNVVYSKCTISSDTSNSMQIPKLRITKQIQKRYDCDKCPKSFASMTSLKNHKRIHRDNNTKKGSSKGGSASASSSSSATKPIWCTVCSQTFKTKRELIVHKKTHSNRKNPIALPDSAFLPENLKRGSHMYGADNKTATTVSFASQQMAGEQQPFKPDMFRPQFYAEYDLSQTNT